MRGESMKDKSKKSTYSTTFGVDPKFGAKPHALRAVQLPPTFIYKKVRHPRRMANFKVVEVSGFEPPASTSRT